MASRIPNISVPDDHRMMVERAKEKIDFDGAILIAADGKLLQALRDAHVDYVSTTSEFYYGWIRRCGEVVRETVDVSLQKFSLIDHDLLGHNEVVNRKAKVVAQDHDLLVSKARALIALLEPHRDKRSARRRSTGIRTIVASIMNDHDWRKEARAYCRAV